MTAFVIPTQPLPQSFTISLVGVTYTLTLKWNDVLYRGGLATPCWVLDIADANGVPMATGLPLVTGSDLLAQHQYLGIGGRLIVQSDNDPNLVPDFTTLGKTGQLYFETS